MAFGFNPFTGNFDLTGGGDAAPFAGQVDAYADLPLDSTAALNSRWLVKNNSGTWPFSTYKQAGIYIRVSTLNASRDTDYQFVGTLPSVMNDNEFLIYDDTDATKNLKFQLSSITTGATRVLTAPNANITIENTGHAAKHHTGGSDAIAPNNISAAWALETRSHSFFSTSTYTLAQGRNVQLNVSLSAISTTGTITLPRLTTDSAQNGDDLFINLSNADTGTTLVIERYIWTGSSYIGSTETVVTTTKAGAWRFRLIGGLWTLQPVATHTHDAADVTTGTFDNARINFAAPPAIGSTTPAAGTFTTLTANDGTFSSNATPLTVTDSEAVSGLNYVLVANRTTTRLFGVRDDGTAEAISFRIPNVPGANVTAQIDSTGLRLRDTNSVGFSSTSNIFSLDTFLRRDAAGVLAQYNGTNAQEFRVYNTITSATNYQRLAIKTKAVTLSALSGASVVTTGGFIPDGAVLVGLTTRVSTAITGATGYDIGDGSDADRWGANVAIALNTSSDNTNWTAGTIECFTAAQEVTLTAVGSNFTGGAVVIVAHYLAGEAD